MSREHSHATILFYVCWDLQLVLQLLCDRQLVMSANFSCAAAATAAVGVNTGVSGSITKLLSFSLLGVRYITQIPQNMQPISLGYTSFVVVGHSYVPGSLVL